MPQVLMSRLISEAEFFQARAESNEV